MKRRVSVFKHNRELLLAENGGCKGTPKQVLKQRIGYFV